MPLSFYISSPFRGLQQERAAVKKAVTENNHAYKDSYEASADPVIASCLADVEGCDIYILLLAYRYGTRTNGGQGPSITELEFDQALQSGKPIYAYFLNFILDAAEGVETDPAGQERLKQFKEKVGSHGRPALCSSLQDLAERIQRLAANPPSLASDRSGTPATKTYTPAELDAWVETYRPAVQRHFEAIPAVQDRCLHVPLPVNLQMAGTRQGVQQRLLLEPRHLQPALEGPGAHLFLITGEGGAGKTSLAFRIARWGLEGMLTGATAGEPAYPVLPVLIDTALAEGETVLSRLRQALEQAIGAARGSLEEALVESLLRRKRLIVLVDHFSELPEEARQRVLRPLPAGLLIVTSRQSEATVLGELASTRIEPLQIAIDQLQRFFHEYLELRNVRPNFNDDDLEPTQRQLRRMVGDKPITVLLAQMFIDDVIAKSLGHGVLAASVPELMLGYVNRISEVIPEPERLQEGIAIEQDWVQRGMQVLALTSLRQGRLPRFQPLSFRRDLALEALNALPGLEDLPRRQALLAWLLRLRLLYHPGQDRSELRLALDPLADYLAALCLLDQLGAEEAEVSEVPEAIWERFLAPLEARPVHDLLAMHGFLLALRDGCQDRRERPRGAATIPAAVPDRLGQLAGIDPHLERLRQQQQRARKLIYELAVPERADRLDAIQKLGAMGEEANKAARLAVEPLTAVLRDAQREPAERQVAIEALAMIGGQESSEAVRVLLQDVGTDLDLRKASAEALGRMNSSERETEEHWQILETILRSDQLVEETDAERAAALLRPLQGCARGIQLLSRRSLPVWGVGQGRLVPMLTLTSCEGAVSTEVVELPVWQLPLPGNISLEVVEIPGGSFQMGSLPGEDGRDVYPNFHPECEGVDVEAQCQVEMPSFAMGRYPVTQEQWRAVAEMEKVEREINPYLANCSRNEFPVESVNWFEVQEWCARLTRHLCTLLDGKMPEVDLPTEAEWEYACRAGSNTAFHYGDTLDVHWATYRGKDLNGRGRQGDFSQGPSPVGAHGLANPWGLADLHGNVFEWCLDLWHPSPLGRPADGSAWLQTAGELSEASSAKRIVRGGSWSDWPMLCRSAFRDAASPVNKFANIGFRVCFPSQRKVPVAAKAYGKRQL